MTFRTSFVSSFLLVACGSPSIDASLQTPQGESEARETAVSDPRFLRTPNRVEGKYVVVLDDAKARLARGDRDATKRLASALAAEHRADVRHVYAHALRGFSAHMSESEARLLAHDPAVAYVQEARSYRVLTVQEDGPALAESMAAEAQAAQTRVTWGLDRIDQVSRPLDKRYSTKNDGQGVAAYVIDTGIRISHEDFGGRALPGFSSVDDDKGYEDCHGHGSHTAGTVGGATWGVAKAVTLYPVRVLDCRGSGDDATVIAGIDWVVEHAALPAVANMSLGGDASQALDDAVRAAIQKGVVFAIAAGNESQDACKVSPARTQEAITVAASTESDWRPMFSNFGSCVDLFAPGKSITSVNAKNDSGSTTMSGTSMASPHVAGAAALVLSERPDLSPQQVRDALVQNAAKDQVGGLWGVGKGSPNLLLNVQWIGVSTD